MPEKKSLDDLVIFGGRPAFEKTLHVGAPNIGNRERLFERISDMLDRRWLTNRGPYVREFEKKVTEYLNVKHCIAMSNGTVALEIAIRALGMRGEVILPSLTFVATAHALQWQEITPVFCDVGPDTYTIDPERIEAMITPRTTGIIGVHLWGRPSKVDQLEQIARRHNLRLLYDAAHAFGVAHHGRMIGSFGDAEVFSFHATKFINSFEGGAVVTNNDILAEKIRLMQNFGFAGRDRVIYIGTNGKMSEVSAAMGLTSLESIASFVTANYRNYKAYQRELAAAPGIRLLPYNEAERRNYQYVVAVIDETAISLSRDLLVQILEAENVLVRRYFYPGCHRMEPYRSYFPHANLLLPVTEELVDRVITLPTGTAIDSQKINQICNIIRLAVAHGPEISKRMQLMRTAVMPLVA